MKKEEKRKSNLAPPSISGPEKTNPHPEGEQTLFTVAGSVHFLPSLAPERQRATMKSANWEHCSEVSINSELNHLREVRASLSECIDALPEDDARNKMAMALSSVQMAIGSLTILQAKACRWILPHRRG